MTGKTDRDARRAEVQERQRPIARWMKSVLDRTDFTATRWAIEAGLGRDTVSRAMKDTYEHVTSTRTLIALANAAKVPPPLDLGDSKSPVPSSADLASVFEELLTRFVPERSWEPGLFLDLGRALRHTLLEYVENPEEEAPLRTVARLVARRLSDEDSGQHD